MNRSSALGGCAAFAVAAMFASSALAAELKVLLPQERSAFQTNERIDLAVVRRDSQPLPEAQLTLKISGEDGSQFTATLPTHAAALDKNLAQTTEHLHLNGWLLRPGKYTVEVTSDGASEKTAIELFSHIRASSFKIVNWGGVQPGKELAEGEDSFGYNLLYAGSGGPDAGNFIRAGVDYMGLCVMSGGHQMDLRTECDWSDPYVLAGGNARVARFAMMGRTQPNVPGVHMYDEPGLTWGKDPQTGKMTPHAVPSQKQSYIAAFGHEPINYRTVDASKPQDVAAWKQWATWKLSFMDAAWKGANFDINQIRPDYINTTQSEYGWTAFTDGYYFNVTRSLPVVSGHGGYDDYGAGYFNPSYTLEMSRARNLVKPTWYLPTWYGNTSSDRFRLEQYLSFITNIQGMATPPELDPTRNPVGMQGIIESNHLMARLGTIFTTMPPTRQPIALLYSMSNILDLQSKDRSMAYAHATKHGQNLQLMYLALKQMQQPMTAIVDEDIVDGSVAAHQEAVILTSIEYLDPAVVKGLERIIRHGGLVLKTSDTSAKVDGAIDLGATPTMPDAAIIDKLMADNKYQEALPYQSVGKQFEAGAATVKALRPLLEKAGIKPAIQTEQPGIVASRETQGDIEYIFAVNATYDARDGRWNATQPVEATLGLPDDQRTVYDAIHGGIAGDFKPAPNQQLVGKFRFGVGEMRVFARTANPIAGVHIATSTVLADFTQAESPIALNLTATVLDNKGGIVSGAIPLRITVTDPLGSTRYDLYRATNMGNLAISLPLAANDPGGKWKVAVEDLLAQTHDEKTFPYHPAADCGALAGATGRAVMLPGEADNLFRFGHLHHDVTIVKGTSDSDAAAAERIQRTLAPWDVRCTIITATEANHARSLSEQEAHTWVGLDGGAKPGPDNQPNAVGFALKGPAILVGNPEDNPLIKYMLDTRYLPYKLDKARFPGRGRGYVAWQHDAISHGEDSVAVMAYDAEGMSEAVGTLYEAVAGIEPLTKWIVPSDNTLQPATQETVVPGAKIIWRAVLPDRVTRLRVEGQTIVALTDDGSETKLSVAGQIQGQTPLTGEAFAATTQPTAPDKAAIEAKPIQLPGKVVKQVASVDGLQAVNYWGGTIHILDASGKLKSRALLAQDASDIAWAGDHLIVGLSTGEVLALQP